MAGFVGASGTQLCRANAGDVHKTLGDENARDPDPLFKVIDGNAVHVEAEAPSRIASQRETAAITDEGPSLLNRCSDTRHAHGNSK